MITVKNLSKSLGRKKILDNLSFNLKGITGIIGPNGAGKSTLMEILADVESGNKGSEILYGGELEKKIGYLPQNFSIYPNLKVIEVLELLAALKGNYDLEHIQDIVKLLNLKEYKYTKMKKLSGGMLRRVGIAQALLNKPDYLILDEPTTGLDIQECINLRNILLKLSTEVNIVISSHLPDDIEIICNHIVVIDTGRKKFEGSLEQLIQLSKQVSYKVIGKVNDLDHMINYGEVVEIIRETEEKVTVKFVSEKEPDKETCAEQSTPGFLESYVLLTNGYNKP